MTNETGLRWWPIGVGAAVGLVVGFLAAPEGPPLNPQQGLEYANLWVQTSGEYRACCLQAYRFAADRLEQKLVASPKEGKPFAVVMDLDETVFDNSGYQTWQYRYGQSYSDESWKEWEKNHSNEVRLVPGAGDFIRRAEKAGIAVVYISNRFEQDREYTIRTLQHLDIDTKNIENRLYLTTGPGDKTGRRTEASVRYRVLMLFGDNLRDFAEVFKAPTVDRDDVAGQNEAIADRWKKVDAQRKHWGDDWIILPNPTYGEWTRLVGGRPLQNMRTTTMKAP